MAKRKRKREPLTKYSIYPPVGMHEIVQQIADDWDLTVGQAYVQLINNGLKVDQAARLAARKASDKAILRAVASGERLYDV